MGNPPSTLRRLMAWGVHFYTGLGLLAAAGIAVAILDGSPSSFRLAFLLMLVATVIDATDGALARLVRVKEVLPGFDGRRLDDLIDFQTYTTLPLLLLFRAHLPAEGQEAWLLVPLLASAYGFCQVAAKTEDGFFLGFPSYWNVIAFYLYILEPPAVVTIILVVGFALLTFLPLRYLYPSQGGRLNRLTNQLGAVWCLLLVWVVWQLPTDERAAPNEDELTVVLTLISLLYPAYYLASSWIISLRQWRRRPR